MKARSLLIVILTIIVTSFVAATATAEDTETEEWSCGTYLDFYMPLGGPAGSVITITGDDAKPNESIQFLWDGAPIGSTTADSNGHFSLQITVPASATVGDHTVTFVGWEGSRDNYQFIECPGIYTVTGSNNPGVTPEQPGTTGTDTPVTQQVTGSTGTTTTTGSLPSTGLPLLPVASLVLGGLGLATIGCRRR